MKATTIEQVIDYVEMLERITTIDNLEIELRFRGIENEKDIEKLTKQQKGNFFTPSSDLPYYWALVTLGNVKCYIMGTHKEIKIVY